MISFKQLSYASIPELQKYDSVKLRYEKWTVQINSEFVWNCHQPLVQLARHTTVQLLRVLGHEGIVASNTLVTQHP
jgi:hypothetical protein